MPASDADPGATELPEGTALAITAEVLYLANLLLLPGLAFVVLWVLYRRHGKTAPPLARCHLRQTVAASLWAGVLLILVNGLIVALGGYHAPATWVILILYFTTCHASLVLLGVLGLSKALAGQRYRYPLLGRACD
ncbi:MAG: hypothetical protein HZB57_13450 [Gammaproteobacteria bacterium]|nr:hypothetical protein [Gammaproteobacteria bacterium]